jgi:hypothetical protein
VSDRGVRRLRHSERTRVAGGDVLAPAHARARDVHELGVVGEDLTHGVGVLGVQGGGEAFDDLSGLGEGSHRDR